MTGHTTFRTHKKHSKRRIVERTEGNEPPLARELLARADGDACKTGGMVTPTLGSTIAWAPKTPLTITWDPSCFPDSTKELDIYLFAAGARINIWTRVDIDRKNHALDAELMPRWWDAKPTVDLQLQILPTGKKPFEVTLPAGPIFTVTYQPPADGSTPPEADTVSNFINNGVAVNDLDKKGMSGGQKAAAVLVPLIVIALGVLAFFKWKRSRGQEKRKAWVENVDKRMSRISGDWKSVTNAGAVEGIRHSMAQNRASTFSFGGGARPNSLFEGDEKTGDISQKRPGVGLRNPSGLVSAADRVSRVSFANDPRPSGESRRTRAFHDSYVPPVPTLPKTTKSDDGSDEGSGAMSPTQTEGAMSLTPEAIRARIAAGRARSASNASKPKEKDVTDGMDGYDEVLPALSLMRTGHANTDSTDDLLFQPPTAPPAAHTSTTSTSAGSPLASTTSFPDPSFATPASAYDAYDYNNSAYDYNNAYDYNETGGATTVASPVMTSMPMPAMQTMSPDSMLRAYAERKRSLVGGGAGGIAYPTPTAGSGRVLFSGSEAGDLKEGKERVGSLGFAPGEYDPDFKFDGKGRL